MSRPWMPWYPADFGSATAHLTAAEVGAYALLRGHYWIKGSLPSDDRRLARVARMTLREWKRSRAAVLALLEDGWVTQDIQAAQGDAFWQELTRKERHYRPDLKTRHWAIARQYVFERDGFACTYCGATANLCCDHVVPIHLGGDSEIQNLTTACRSCNSSKGAKSLSIWRPRFQ